MAAEHEARSLQEAVSEPITGSLLEQLAAHEHALLQHLAQARQDAGQIVAEARLEARGIAEEAKGVLAGRLSEIRARGEDARRTLLEEAIETEKQKTAQIEESARDRG